MDRPRRTPVRSNPSRAAKLKKPVRETRSTRSLRSTRSTGSTMTTRYKEISSSPSPDEYTDYYSDSPAPSPKTPTPTRKRKNDYDDDSHSQPSRKSQRQTRSQNTTKATPIKAIAPRTPRRSTAATPTASNNTPSSYPPWANLPYLVLLSIFDQVAAPIRDTSSRREDVSDSVNTLLSASRTCKAFAEPSLAALYRCPPFYHPWRYTKDPFVSMNQFIRTLNMDPLNSSFKYRPKIQTLLLEVGSTLIPKFQVNYHSLQSVIPLLDSLSRIELCHEYDDPPYRRLDENVRFRGNADEILKMLAGSEEDGVRPRELKSWRWNSRLTDDTLSLDKLEKFHLHPSFASLRKVAFVNYQIASWGQPKKIQLTEEMEGRNHLKMVQLSACISALPNLQHLILESSTLVTGSLLSRLPTTLKHLELINCWEVVADDLANFLLTHGHHLRSLTINHCQSLSLAFLPVLQSACPNLEHLYMDLSYFRHHEHYADNKPEYDTLLAEDQVPAWPASIQSIEILHMRKWDFKAAEMFFGSLVQNAPNLPNLRRIAFRVALDIGWRQRQELREFWVEKMVAVFKRRMKSTKDLKMLNFTPTETKGQGLREPENTDSLTTPKRRSTRIANIGPTPTSSEGEANYPSKAQLARASALSKELQRLRGSGLLLKERLLREHDADDEDSEDELAADHSDQSRLDRKVRKVTKHLPNDNEFIHGMCDVVDIQVDNHRPRERQYDMDDFLDSEDESDEEWDGGDADVFD